LVPISFQTMLRVPDLLPNVIKEPRTASSPTRNTKEKLSASSGEKLLSLESVTRVNVVGALLVDNFAGVVVGGNQDDLLNATRVNEMRLDTGLVDVKDVKD